jgi:hypothetical protein
MASPLCDIRVCQPGQIATFNHQDRFVVTLKVPNRSAKAEKLMDAIDALDRATHRVQAETEDQAIPPTEAISISLPEKTNQAEDHEETGKFAHWFPLPPNTSWTGPKPFIAKPPFGCFPPEIWLMIMKGCPTPSIKNLARTSKNMNQLAMTQLLDTVVLRQGLLCRHTLPSGLDNATVIGNPALFSTVILNRKQLYWFTAVKTVFMVYRSRLYVVRVSALPLVCHHITARFGPQEDLSSYKWMVWTRKKVIVTLGRRECGWWVILSRR